MYNRPLEMTVTLRTALSTEPYDDALIDEDARERVLLVEAGGDLYAIQVAAVRAVMRARTITRVPGAPLAMSGLVNVRGMVVTVLDLMACVKLPHAGKMNDARPVTPARGEMPTSIVLLERGSRVVGLGVDAVRDVRPLDDLETDRAAALELSRQFGPDMVVGSAHAGGDTVLVLDVVALLARHLISFAET